ncbi:MAG: L,D-transpeptidase [Alphaproteobacteria bacterium]|nr:L,D-transpeptidase [Alphaproteobacteria bacterium]
MAVHKTNIIIFSLAGLLSFGSVPNDALAQQTVRTSREGITDNQTTRLPMYLVRYTGTERPNTVLISNERGYLYRVLGGQGSGFAVAYPIAIGEDGMAVPVGTELKVVRMDENPTWTPTAAMKLRNPALRNVTTVPPGPHNPLGLFSMVLAYKDGRATEWRIHATNDESSIGYATSSGCFRMYTSHIRHFFNGSRLANGLSIPAVGETSFGVKVFHREVPGIEDRGPRHAVSVPGLKP